MRRPQIPRQILDSISGSQHKALGAIRPLRRPASVPMEHYTTARRSVLTGGYGAALVDSTGAATVQVGPQGVGTVWYPAQASIATSSGAADTSTCALYLAPNLPVQELTQILAQSYAAGGDTLGISTPPLFPGYFIVAVWAGAKAGDLATLTVYGAMDSLA